MPDPLTVVLLPGFTRGPGHLDRWAAACAESGWASLRPRLAPPWLPVLYLDRARLQRIAADLHRQVGGGPVVVAGHSAGASAGCYLAALLVGRGADVRGVVLVDGVESPNHLIRRSLPHLAGLRLAAVLAPPSPCNRNGALAVMLEQVPDARVELVDGAGHGDIEGPGLAVYRRACGDRSDVATADRFLRAVLEATAWAGAPAAAAA